MATDDRKGKECTQGVSPSNCPLAQNGWHEYRRMVLKGMGDQQEALTSLRAEQEEASLATVRGMAALEARMNDKFARLDKAIAKLRASAGAWGAAAGLFMAFLGFIANAYLSQ